MTSPASEINFLQRFFGPGNEVRLEAISDGSIGADFVAWLQPWINDLQATPPRPVVLPRRRTDRRLEWYGLAFSQRQARSLRDDLTAFVGPSYSNFSGQQAQLDPADPVDRAVLELTGGNAFRFEVIPASSIPDVRDAISLMRRIWLERPFQDTAIPRPTGRILRDLEMALEAGNAEDSMARIEELRAGGRLTAQNTAFLKIRRLAALNLWGELLALPEIITVLSLRRPVRVSEALIRAVYRVELASFEAEGNAVGALDHFRRVALPKYSPLYKSRSLMTAPEVLKSFMLLAAASDPPRPELVAEMLSQSLLPESDRLYLETLAALAIGPAAGARTVMRGNDLEVAKSAVDLGAYDSAFLILAKASPSRARVELMVQCAYELDTLESARETATAMTHLSLQEQREVLAQRWYRERWEALTVSKEDAKPVPDEQFPANWKEWLLRLNKGVFPQALEIASRGALEWDPIGLLSKPEEITQVAQLLISDRPVAAQTTLRNAIPHIISFLRRVDDVRGEFRPITESLIFLLVAEDQIGASDLVVILDLISSVFDIGVTAAQYEELVGYLSELWIRVDSPRYVDWSLDALDMLVSYPAVSPGAREIFLSAVIASFSRWGRRLEPLQWDVLKLICQDLGARDRIDRIHEAFAGVEEAAAAPPDFRSRLRGKKLGIYTLTETVSTRVRGFLEGTFDDVKVLVSNEKVGSDRLRRLAEEADIFLMAVRSAKHAATDFIEVHRPKGKTTLYAAGKGSASMLRILYSHLAGEL
jgi:hypothetical protein